MKKLCKLSMKQKRTVVKAYAIAIGMASVAIDKCVIKACGASPVMSNVVATMSGIYTAVNVIIYINSSILPQFENEYETETE